MSVQLPKDRRSATRRTARAHRNRGPDSESGFAAAHGQAASCSFLLSLLKARITRDAVLVVEISIVRSNKNPPAFVLHDIQSLQMSLHHVFLFLRCKDDALVRQLPSAGRLSVLAKATVPLARVNTVVLQCERDIVPQTVAAVITASDCLGVRRRFRHSLFDFAGKELGGRDEECDACENASSFHSAFECGLTTRSF